ncbi:MAG: HAD family hydrolase [bacterium]|jgi:HAD superfamily hydrolase (TIGR01509 family)
MNSFEAFLFDADGVVIDTRESVERYWNALADRHQRILSEQDYEEHIWGVPWNHTLKHLFPTIPESDYDSINSGIQEYEKNLSYRAVPGVIEFLQKLRATHIPTALVTSGQPWKVQTFFRQLSLDAFFDCVITADDIPRGKPAPDCYRAAARKLGRATEKCLVFEDALSGVKSALAAGSVCIGVQQGKMAERLQQEGACFVIPNFLNVVFIPSNGDHCIQFSTSHRIQLRR